MLTRLFLAAAFGLAVQAHAEESVSPTAKAEPAPSPAAAAAPASPTAEAVPEAMAPELPGLSGTAETLSAPADATGDTSVAEEVYGEGIPMLDASAVAPDLLTLSSEVLASIAGGVEKDSLEVFYDPEQKQTLSEAGPGAWKVDVLALYSELAKRMIENNGDKPARQAISLAIYKDDLRAKEAKDLAHEDNLANKVIKQLEGGRARSRVELEGLAAKGNRRARAYLGLDKPAIQEEPVAVTPTPQSLSAAAALASPAAEPVSITPSPVNVSGSAKP